MRSLQSDKQAGLTLVEVMIALALSSIVLGGLFSLFLTTRRNEDVSRQLNQIGENARFFSEFIAHDLRMAGYEGSGCTLSGPPIEWNGDILTIRYCRETNETPSATEPKNRVYQFGGDGTIRYDSDYHPDHLNLQPLIEDAELKHIWFGKQGPDGFRYVTQNASDFPSIRTVRIELEMYGDSAVNKILQTFYFTTTIRNNLVGSSTTPTP